MQTTTEPVPRRYKKLTGREANEIYRACLAGRGEVSREELLAEFDDYLDMVGRELGAVFPPEPVALIRNVPLYPTDLDADRDARSIVADRLEAWARIRSVAGAVP